MAARTVVIGGGFYGACLALYLRAEGREVVLLEQGTSLLGRASLVNQARIHVGYHYPRSYLTAVRSLINFPRFIDDFPEAVVDDFEKIYAIPRQGSKISGPQFQAFCRKVGAPIREAQPGLRGLFDRDLIDSVFSVREFAFDALCLRRLLEERLRQAGVAVRLGARVTRIARLGVSGLAALGAAGLTEHADEVFVATYSRINALLRASHLPPLPLKHEIAEIALVRHAAPLARVGVTVMDGPFFSTMPFPARAAHSFSHVRYTPHGSWNDLEAAADPDEVLAARHRQTTYPLMAKDAARYLPLVARAEYLDSLFEIKTVLLQNEGNDGRPILLRRDHGGLKGLTVVMGGKIDNIYDICSALAADSGGPAEADQQRISAILRGRHVR